MEPPRSMVGPGPDDYRGGSDMGGGDHHVHGRLGHLQSNLLHFTCDSLSEHLRTLDRYTTLAAQEIAAAPPLVVRGVKHVLEQGEGKSVADGLDYVAAWNSAFLASEDLGEATQAFAMKRTPVFKGR